MVLAEEAIIAQGKKMRRNGRSPSGECLGILRMNNWCNGVDVCLWNFKSLVVLSELSQSGRLVAHMDGTKFGNLGLGNTTVGKNLIHTRITIQPTV